MGNHEFDTHQDQAAAGSGLPHPAEDARTALQRLHAGARLLLAEDNPVNQEVAVGLLHAAGLRVEVAGDGERAVEAACADDFALVLMDMRMPRMDGLEAAAAIRRRCPGLPIVAMTASAYPEDRAACLAAGMDDHLSKPVLPDALYAMLLRWLPRRSGGGA